MGISISHLVLVLFIVLIVFGAKRIPEVMSDLAKGYRAFTDGLKEKDQESVDTKVSNVRKKKG